MEQKLTEQQIRRIHCLYYSCDAILNERADLMVNASMNPELKNYVANNYSTERVIKMEDLDVVMYRTSFIKLLLKPLTSISDEDAVEVVRILLDKPSDYAPIEIEQWDWCKRVLVRREPDILDKKTEVTMWVVINYERGSVEWTWEYQKGLVTAVSEKNCPTAHLAYQFLNQRGYAVPLFIEPNHPLNGQTAIELGIAIEQPQ